MGLVGWIRLNRSFMKENIFDNLLDRIIKTQPDYKKIWYVLNAIFKIIFYLQKINYISQRKENYFDINSSYCDYNRTVCIYRSVKRGELKLTVSEYC